MIDKARRAALLAGLILPSAAPPTPKPSPPRRRFLPGETRATCGIDGFREMDVATYLLQLSDRARCRELYSNTEPRDLVPPISHPPTAVGYESFDPLSVPCEHTRRRIARLENDNRVACYTINFLLQCCVVIDAGNGESVFPH
jgi:hypothetical protein